VNDERDPHDTWPEQDRVPGEPDQAPSEPVDQTDAGNVAEPVPDELRPDIGDATHVYAEPVAPPAEPVAPPVEPAAMHAEPLAQPPESAGASTEGHEPPPSDVEAYSVAPDDDGQRRRDEELTAAHTVPATVVGESTQCPRCGTENRPGIAFCRNCGQRLVAAGAPTTLERPGTPEGTQACPRCGTHNRAGVAFCQNCGANLRGAPAGYVPPVAETPTVEVASEAARHAVLGPIVLLIGVIGLITGWLLPFLTGGSLFDRAAASGGYGVAFWTGFNTTGGSVADQLYYTLGALAPLLVLLLVILAIAGFMRAQPGALQSIGLAVALIWAIGLAVLFVVVELLPASGGGLAAMLRALSPAGIIFLLASLIVVIGTLTRFGRS
jgi:hypothetical protein